MQYEPMPPAQGVMLPHLRAWRLARGLTVRELARRAFCSRQYIYLLESGERGVSRRFIPLLALALDMDPSTLQQRAPAAPQLTAGRSTTEAPAMAAS